MNSEETYYTPIFRRNWWRLIEQLFDIIVVYYEQYKLTRNVRVYDDNSSTLKDMNVELN